MAYLFVYLLVSLYFCPHNTFIMRKIITLLLLAYSITANSQIKSKLSAPIDVVQEGWNKAIMLDNGNTLFFHFQYHRSIQVVVFDSTGTEVASRKHACEIVDINSLEDSRFKGLHSINGEAVLFIYQPYRNKTSLIRLRFDPVTGDLISEDIVARAKSFSTPVHSYVERNIVTGGYFIINLFYEDLKGNKRLVVDEYSKLHKLVKSYPVKMDDKYKVEGIKDIHVSSNGHLLFSMSLLVEDAADIHVSYPYLGLCYLPSGYDNVVSKVIELPSSMDLTRIDVSYNKFYNFWNVLLSFYIAVKADKAVPGEVLLVYDQSLKLLKQNTMMYDHLNGQIKTAIDTTNIFVGYVNTMFTSEYGITTLVKTDQNIADSIVTTTLNKVGYIGLTHLKEGGGEMGGVLLPRPYFDGRFIKEAVDKAGLIFQDKSIGTECAKVNVLGVKGNSFIIYNDVNENFDMPLAEGGLVPISSFDQTNAVCVYINRKRKVKKEHLFKPLQDGVYNSIIGTGNFLENKRKYVAIVKRKVYDTETIHLGWISLPY